MNFIDQALSKLQEDIITIDKDMPDDNTYNQFMLKLKGKKGITVKRDVTTKKVTISGKDTDLAAAGIK